jgi:DNA-binding response OmpR family regulator
MLPSKATKILLVEDDAAMKAVLRTLLEIEGYIVSLPPDRIDQQALVHFIRQEVPDVILMDVHLRDISGIDILRRVKDVDELKNTRVIMTSGSDVKILCLEAGAANFILKPFMPDELLSQLRG